MQSSPVSTETYLADILIQNAPLLAGLKPSGIFTIQNDRFSAIRELFAGSDIELYPLYTDTEKTTLLFYREAALARCLTDQVYEELLLQYGYRKRTLTAALRHFRNRFRAFRMRLCSFPHEIGVFLGYPLCDIRGFIENNGRNELYTRYWKVYDQLEEAMKVFRTFDDAVQSVSFKLSNGVALRHIVMGYCQKRVAPHPNAQYNAQISRRSYGSDTADFSSEDAASFGRTMHALAV